jgi:hypothetical protein
MKHLACLGADGRDNGILSLIGKFSRRIKSFIRKKILLAERRVLARS